MMTRVVLISNEKSKFELGCACVCYNSCLFRKKM